MKITRAFAEKFKRFSDYMTEAGEMTLEEVEEMKASIRQDAQDGPDTLRKEGFKIATAEERLAHWDRYMDWWLPNSGINERMKRAA